MDPDVAPVAPGRSVVCGARPLQEATWVWRGSAGGAARPGARWVVLRRPEE